MRRHQSAPVASRSHKQGQLWWCDARRGGALRLSSCSCVFNFVDASIRRETVTFSVYAMKWVIAVRSAHEVLKFSATVYECAARVFIRRVNFPHRPHPPPYFIGRIASGQSADREWRRTELFVSWLVDSSAHSYWGGHFDFELILGGCMRPLTISVFVVLLGLTGAQFERGQTCFCKTPEGIDECRSVHVLLWYVHHAFPLTMTSLSRRKSAEIAWKENAWEVGKTCWKHICQFFTRSLAHLCSLSVVIEAVGHFTALNIYETRWFYSSLLFVSHKYALYFIPTLTSSF